MLELFDAAIKLGLLIVDWVHVFALPLKLAVQHLHLLVQRLNLVKAFLLLLIVLAKLVKKLPEFYLDRTASMLAILHD